MSFRHPPKGNVPPAGRKPRAARIVKFEEPPENFWRRAKRLLLRPAVVIPVVFLTTISVGVLGYYYYVFSQRIDRLLRGEVFTRSAGIYAAPKQIRVGDGLSVDELVEYLKRIGYVERTQQAEKTRGRYATNGSALDVEPSEDAVVDDKRLFPRLRVQFGKGGRTITGISNLDAGGAKAQAALLEPELITSLGGRERERRKVVGYKDLPEDLVKAIVVTEDRTFFDHHGINVRGIVRAFVRRYEADPNSPIARQGGSSITQQLVKNLFLTPEQSLKRKAAEAYMSVILETRLKKEDIFALYCNEVYLGQRAGGFSIKGFGEAAEAYFNKDVTSLTLAESALLAGIIRSPNRYNPYKYPDVATERRNQVLKSMQETGAIDEAEAAAAMAAELKVVRTKGRIDTSEAPYFIDYAQSQLADVITDTSAAERLRIYTTVDMDLQRAAYQAVTKQLAALDKVQSKRFPPGTLQAALVAMRADTGEVVAMVGGRDYEKSQLNRATDAMRQPGSVFKPFVYAAALNTAYDPTPQVFTAASVFTDAPQTFHTNGQEYSPGNFGDHYSNAPVTLRDALVRSLNVVTVEIAQKVTIGRVMNLAVKAGLPKPKQNYLAHALGTNEATPLQVASAYTAFAQSGKRTTPLAISRVTNGAGATVVAPTAQKNDVMTPEVAYVMTSFMKDVINRGTAAAVRARGFKANVAGKTGTSRDGWFAGYTPGLVCVVYVGFDDNSDLGMKGADSALPIWTDFMAAALAAHPEWGGDWEMPAGVQQAEIDPRTGMLATPESESKRIELFIGPTAPISTGVPSPDETPLTTEEGEGVEGGGAPDVYEVPPLPTPTPLRQRNATRPGDDEEDDSPHLSGFVILDIDPTTGLIAVDSCPQRRSKTFAIGTEPRQY